MVMVGAINIHIKLDASYEDTYIDVCAPLIPFWPLHYYIKHEFGLKTK